MNEDWGHVDGRTAVSQCGIHWVWFTGKTFLNPRTEGVLVQKMAELSQISLDDTSWVADVTPPAVLPFPGKEYLPLITAQHAQDVVVCKSGSVTFLSSY